MAYQIRELRAGDINAVSRLIRSAYLEVAQRFALTAANAPAHPSNCAPRWIEAEVSRGITYFLLLTRSTLCGCVAFELATESLAYLERLAVAPDYRRQGFGTALVEHALARACAAGAQEASIGVIAEHTELVTWYEKRGFRLEETWKFAHLPFVVAYMRRPLGVRSGVLHG